MEYLSMLDVPPLCQEFNIKLPAGCLPDGAMKPLATSDLRRIFMMKACTLDDAFSTKFSDCKPRGSGLLYLRQ